MVAQMQELPIAPPEPQKTAHWFRFFLRKKVIFAAFWSLYASLFLGLFSGVGIGIADNGDGVRVTSPAGLNPQTETGLTRGQGYVVTEFFSAANKSPASVFDRMTSLHYPTANAYFLTLMGVLSPDRTVSLFALGWLYLIVGLTFIWLAPINKSLLPMAITMGVFSLAPFLRWTTSAFADTPAFFGFVAVLVANVSLLSRLNRREFFRVHVLLWWGVLLIALSKAAYAVAIPFVLVFFFATVFVFQRATVRASKLLPLAGVTVAGLALVSGMLAVQFGSSDREQSNIINNHHFVMSVVVPNYPVDIVEQSVPEPIRELAPEGYWPRTEDWRDVPGWEETMTDSALVTELRLAIFTQPALLYELMAQAVASSTTPELDYLVPNTWLTDEAPPISAIPMGLYVATTGLVHFLLYPLSIPGLAIPLVVAVAIAALVVVVFRPGGRRGDESGESWVLAALTVLSGVFAGALAGAAILGDGFTELEKHLIMTSFLFTIFVVSALVLAGREIFLRARKGINSRKR